jgi:hypothetical protein
MMMARAPCTFRQQDVTRAIQGIRAAGVDVQQVQVEIDKAGKIVVKAGPAPQAVQTAAPDTENEWDDVK